MVVRLTRCVRELRESYGQAPLGRRAHSIKNGVDRSATTAGHLIDEAAAALRELDADGAPICLIRMTRDQPLVREAIASASSGRRRDTETPGEVAHRSGALLEKYEHSILGEAHVIRHREERLGRDTDERTRCAYDYIAHLLTSR
jgi:hypothetical protein